MSERGHQLPDPTPRVGTDAADAVPVWPALGENLRRLRRRKGYSLDRLARASDVSRAMLGQIELGQSVPTVQLLWRVASGLCVSFVALLSNLLELEDEVPTRVVRKRRQAALIPAPSAAGPTNAEGPPMELRPLFPPTQTPGLAEFYELRLRPRGVHRSEAHSPAMIENLVVTQGSLVIDVGAERYELATGDAIVFRADVKHRYSNPEDGEAIAYLVMTRHPSSAEPEPAKVPEELASPR
jgi:transcriptional regulator with XRE-family HTH domain